MLHRVAPARSWIFLAAFVICPMVPAAWAQGVPVVERTEPELVYSQDFTELRSLRELSGGAVIAIEGNGGEVMLLDPDGSGVNPVGRNGSGPGEYRQPCTRKSISQSKIVRSRGIGLGRNPRGSTCLTRRHPGHPGMEYCGGLRRLARGHSTSTRQRDRASLVCRSCAHAVGPVRRRPRPDPAGQGTRSTLAFGE